MPDSLQVGLFTAAVATFTLLLGILGGLLLAPGEDGLVKDACRAEIEQSYTAYANGQNQHASDLLGEALTVTCLSGLKD